MISYIRGYYVITVEGIGTEQFLNHLIRNKVNVYNVNRTSNTKIEFCVEREDMKRFKQVYRGSKYEIKVKQKTGIPFVLKRIYKHKGMWIFALVSLVLLMLTSQFVTDIYIQSPEGIKQEELRKELYNAGLKPGMYKKSIDRKEIRDYLMSKFDDIAYVSLNVKGTNIFVTVTKKAETLKSNEDSNYCNIIAEKNGIIEKVIPRSGNQVVNPGDIVQKGDVLLNGADTKSIPEVWANTFYEVKKSASYIENEKEKTGNSKKVFTFKFYDNKYMLRRKINYSDYTVENKEYKLTLGNYTFPLSINVSTFHETKKVEVKKDKEELKKELSKQALKELEYILPVSAKIIDIKHGHKVNKNMLEYVVTVETSENIAEVYKLSKSEAEQIIKNQSKAQDGEEVPSNPEKRPINDIRNEFEDNSNNNNESNESN
ncbi:sporulation protein YqfD [Romboutsia weinsteinii]|uniref:Sporulation protein YqfD n=1 Tax=Romboutsia weinsteinii TaxID=2020949 RepID=A0A371JAI7_9FIRM|nr:sporulation protein YqfD [Romboutsia weinsteinii]RDY29723.1 sporulation protein YqfD [Romboutsia weinsteinii]